MRKGRGIFGWSDASVKLIDNVLREFCTLLPTSTCLANMAYTVPEMQYHKYYMQFNGMAALNGTAL